MTPHTDKFFHTIKEKAVFVLLENDREKEYTMQACDIFAMEKDIWHKPRSHMRMKFIYLTSVELLHRDTTNPRNGKQRK